MHVCLNRATAGGGLPFQEFVKLSADAGFEGCDVDMGWVYTQGAAATRELFASHRQKFGGWGPAFDWRKDEATLREGLPHFAHQAEVARALDVDACATWIMPSSERPLMENWKFHVERLKHLAAILNENGLRLGLEFVSPYHLRRHFPHEFIFTPGQMLELAADVGDNVGLLVDCFHCYNAGTTWEHLAQIPANKIVLVHINDCPPGPLGEVQDFKRVLPGEGVIDLRGFIGALEKTGYAGPLSLEVFSETLKQIPPAEAAMKAWEATRAVVL